MNIIKKIESFDERVSSALRIDPENKNAFRIAAILAHSGDSWLWCGVLFILWLFSTGEKEQILAYWGGAIAATACFVFVLKRIIARTRPEGDWGEVYRKTDPYSFPSGHAVRGGLILMLAIHTFHSPWIIALFAIWAVLMCFSRVATGVHYFIDILGGFIIGILIGVLWISIQPVIYSNFPILFNKSLWFK